MEKTDRRKYPRVEVHSSITYWCINKEGSLIIDQNMGVAKNISQNGILLETGRELESAYISLMFVDIEEKLAKIKGEIAYSKQNESGMFSNGIKFMGNHAQNTQFARKLIRSCHYRKSDFVLVLCVNP